MSSTTASGVVGRLALVLAIFTATTTATFYVYPGNAFLQSQAYPTKCLTVTTGNALVLLPCDLVSVKQLISMPLTQAWATTPSVLTFYGAGYKIMQVIGSGTYDGAPIDANAVYDSQNVQPNQKWKLVNGAFDDTFMLQAQIPNSYKCLTAEGGEGAGSYMDQWDCSANQPHQRWRIIQWPRVPDTFDLLLKNVAWPASCLDNPGGGSSDGTTPNLFPCVPSAANHHWTLVFCLSTVACPSGGLLIKNGASGKCLQINGAGNFNGASVTQWTCPDVSATATQAALPQFLWTPLSPDPESSTQRLQFQSAVTAPGKCLTPEGSIAGLGGYTDLWDCTPVANAPHQYFTWSTPAQYLKPFGSVCLGPLECLSNSCLATCQKGGTGKGCQTKNDCTSGVCNDGKCT